MSIREITERNERLILCYCAAFSDSSKGREKPEQPCEIRTEFCRDRDRIIHCKAFRRLKQKTQVFLSPEGDHYRTRLTHTMEVDQIARTIARGLRLNEDLTEAIALGHDLGHTPFGHAGERALNALCDGGFTHYEQSVRVVSRLEKDREGLNLTVETLDGILHHTKGEQAATLEGRIVRLADRIAYLNHDFEDATHYARMELELPRSVTAVLGVTKSERITALVADCIAHGDGDIGLSRGIQEAFDSFYEYMWENLYLSKKAKAEESKVAGMLGAMFEVYERDTQRLPEMYRIIADKEGRQRAAADYISGMSDAFAVFDYEQLFIPKSWTVK